MRAYLPFEDMPILLAISDFSKSVTYRKPCHSLEVWPPQRGHTSLSLRKLHSLHAL